MKKNIILVTMLLFVTNLSAIDIKNGEELFKDASCMECHNREDFQKNKKKVNSFQKLYNSVQACQFQNDVSWFDDETEDVSYYLNKKYYKFHKTLLN